MTQLDDLHYGERLRDLLPAFTRIMQNMGRDGSDFVIDVHLPPDEALPFVRAMHRAEAELLIEDADALTDLKIRDRTSEQRELDALVRVVAGFRTGVSS